MSIDTHTQSVADFRCEAVTADNIASPCLHSRLAPSLQPANEDRGASHGDDPAVLIGLAFAFLRQGSLLDGQVPEPLLLRLSALANGGNDACRLLLDWLRNRNRDLRRSDNECLIPPSTITVPSDPHRPRRSPRDRMLAASARSGPPDERRRCRTRPRDPVLIPATAIIAAETGGRVDG